MGPTAYCVYFILVSTYTVTLVDTKYAYACTRSMLYILVVDESLSVLCLNKSWCRMRAWADSGREIGRMQRAIGKTWGISMIYRLIVI